MQKIDFDFAIELLKGLVYSKEECGDDIASLKYKAKSFLKHITPVPSASVEGKEAIDDDAIEKAFYNDLVFYEDHDHERTKSIWKQGYLAGHAAALASSPAPTEGHSYTIAVNSFLSMSEDEKVLFAKGILKGKDLVDYFAASSPAPATEGAKNAVWVKASERLPEKGKSVFWKRQGNHRLYTGYDPFSDTKGMELDAIFWLDESAPQREGV